MTFYWISELRLTLQTPNVIIKYPRIFNSQTQAIGIYSETGHSGTELQCGMILCPQKNPKLPV